MLHDPDDPFLTFTDLIYKLDHSIATLATAVEQHGIYFWDRFGRFSKSTNGKGVEAALDNLAWLYKERFDDELGEEKIDEDMYREWGDRYGWLSSDFPDLEGIVKNQSSAPEAPKPSGPGQVKSDNANAGIIRALLMFIRGEFKEVVPHPNFKSENQLSEFLDKKMMGFPGCSERNLKAKFKHADGIIPKNEL